MLLFSLLQESPKGPSLDVPANVTPKQLELLLNQLLETEEPTPYSFYLQDSEILESLAASLEAQVRKGEK